MKAKMQSTDTAHTLKQRISSSSSSSSAMTGSAMTTNQGNRGTASKQHTTRPVGNGAMTSTSASWYYSVVSPQ